MSFSLIDLFKERTVNHISNFSDSARRLDILKLERCYLELVKGAPRRAERGKDYFVEGHNGITSSGNYSNRSEEHLAVALFNATKRGEGFSFADVKRLSFVDYQLPLKARQGDKGVGKVDLFCAIENSIPAVAELKVVGKNGQLGDTPLKALLEGLAYCAIVEANMGTIAREAKARFKINLKLGKPDLIVIAPHDYWSNYLKKNAAGDWVTTLSKLVEKIKNRLKINTHFLSLRNCEFEMGLSGKPAELIGNCRVEAVQALI
jgi:hypothetical protein